ncbi:MAG: Ig-like domain-containing protein [Anaerolineae bacterium]|nr:Ig-like domain-containing protein [Anaerolineae bacterium]
MNRKQLFSLLLLGALLASPVLACRWPFQPEPTPSQIVTPAPLPPIQPLLLQRSPGRGEEAPLDAPLTFTFDQPMDPASVERAFSIDPAVDGRFAWPDPVTMVFTPADGWERATRYQVKLEPSAASAEGLPLREETSFTFATVGYLEVTQVIPADGTEEIAPDSTVTVMFNRPVVPLQLASMPVEELPAPLEFDPPMDGSGEWLNTSIYMFRPSAGFTPGVTYHATVLAGLADTTGGVLQEDVQWSFTIQPPCVLWTQPGNMDEMVPLNQPITVTFSQPMEPAAVESAFSLTDDDGVAVQGRFRWSEDNSVVTFTPNQRGGQPALQLNTLYTARIDRSARAATGNATLEDSLSWSFLTVPYPRIVATVPGDGATVAPNVPLEIYFSAPMDTATLMRRITILPEPTYVYTYWSSYDNHFVVSWDIQPSTGYEVRLAGGMADPYGNAIEAGRTIRFTTEPLEPLAYLATPGNVGTYNGYTATQVYVYHRNVSQVNLALYRLTWSEFTQLTGPRRWEYWDDFAPRSQSEIIRDWSIAVEAPLNEGAYLRVQLAEDGGPLPPGIYFLEASAPEVRAQEWWEPSRHVLVVSRVHLTLKFAQREALVWATDLATGKPVPGLDLKLLSPHGEVLAQGTSDSDGVLRVAFEAQENVWDPYTVVAGSPGAEQFAVTTSDWYEGIGPWDFGFSTALTARPYRFYLYTDRPIYRPGQPVYFRGLVRAEDDARYQLLDGIGDVAVRAYDDQGQEIYSATLPLSDFGTFNGELTLGDEATLGYYYVEARIADQSDGVGFQVAEYRRPEFEVAVETDQAQVLAGETVNVAIQATYFFGGPVADAAVRWTLLQQDYAFQPDVPGWWDWSDTSRWDWWETQQVPGWGRIVADGEGATDAEGRFLFSVPAEIAEEIFSQQLTIEATVTDVNDQSVSNRATVIAHKGLYYIGLRPTRYVGQVGQEQEIEVRTVDWAGDGVGEASLSITFNRRQWLNVQEEDEYGNLYWTWTPSDTVVYSQTVATDRDGQALAAFVPPEGGSYIVRAEGVDEAGNVVVSATWLWVSGYEYVSWRQENNDRIQLIADQRQYQPGDTARILVPSPFQGEVNALFTVERGRVIDHWVQTLSGNAETIELPITADYAPNVFVSVVLMKGVDETNPVPAYRVGYVSFDVSTVEQELTITVTPDRDMAAGDHYAPQESVSAEIQVTDSAGRPVEAEVGLAVVDQSVLSLAAPNAPAIAAALYGERGLGIRTAAGLSISVDRLTLQLASEAKGGGGGGDMRLGAESIRQDFPDTAFWEPSIRTDSAGRATVEFRLPDQLTTWHIDARAVTQDTLVGQTELNILSTKDLLVRPVTPRFFVAGDRADLAAVVHNNTSQELAVEVWLEAGGVTLLDDARHTVTIAAGGKERVEWPVEVPSSAPAAWADLTFYAQGGGYSDAVKPPAGLPPEQLLPIYHYSAMETVGTSGQVDAAGSVLEGIAMPPGVDTTQGELTVRIEPSLAAGMTGGLDYLEHYPYECTEQVVSRFLPNVLTFRALTQLGLEDPELETNLRAQVAIALQRLYARQHYDGGWGWWVNDESNTLTTAYVVFGLTEAREAGFAVSSSVIERGIGFLQNRLEPADELEDTWQADRQAFVLYVLAEANVVQESDLASLYETRGRLSHHGRAYLALAFGQLKGGDARITTLLSDLNNAAIVSASGAHWQETETGHWNWNTDVRTTALALDVLARLDPDNDLAPQAVRWLMHARTADHWETTQETAWSLIALTDWMVATGELEGSYDWAVRINGKEVNAGQVTPETVREVSELQVAVAELLLGETNRLEIARGDGPGRLYYTAHLEAYLPVEDVRALNRGIVVGRVYERSDCEEACEPLASAQVGETVRVRLTVVAPYDLHYVVIEDPFPAGAEPVDTSLQTTSVVGEPPEMRRTDVGAPWYWRYWGWGWWWFSNTDLRDEKLVLFATYLPAGTYEYTYLLQMGLEGEYRVIPTTAYEMYFPEVMGRGDGMIFTIERPE